MSVRFLMCLIVFWGESTASSGKVNQIAQGNDVSYSCLSGEASWPGSKLDNTVRVKINGTEYLLIKNFQKQNKGEYICGKENLNLELKDASTKDKSVLFRASERDSLLLFCKSLLNASFNTTWSWRPHNSNTTDKYITLGLNSTHFRNRLHIKNNNNDFSASISPVHWSDTGKYECQLSGNSPVFEVVVVRVHAYPQQPKKGDDVTLKCEVSNQTQNIKLYWINMKTQENFPNPHQLRNFTTGQMNWACAVFNSSMLKALIPLTLTISQPSGESKTTESPDVSQTAPGPQSSKGISQHISLIGTCTVFFFILIVLIGAVCWRKWINKRMESSPPERDVTYADVKFRQRPENPDVASPVCELPQNSNDAPDEEKEVLYSSVKFYKL